MLKEYEGMIDSEGLCVLRLSQQTPSRNHWAEARPGYVSFWAILEVESATSIVRELKAGYRSKSLRLLEELAISLGTQWE